MKVGDQKHRLSKELLSDIASAFAAVFGGTLDTALGGVAGAVIGVGGNMAYCLAAAGQLGSDSLEPLAMSSMAFGAAAGACMSLVAQARHVHSVRLIEDLAVAAKDKPEILEKSLADLRLWERETIMGTEMVIRPASFDGRGGFYRPVPVTFAVLIANCREHDFSSVNALVKAEIDKLKLVVSCGEDDAAAIRGRLAKALTADEVPRHRKQLGPR